MKIYFDGTLIDSQYYSNFKVSYKMFDDNEVFKLGKTPCKQVTLGIYIDGMSSIPSEVTIEINDEIYGTFGVDNCELKDYNYDNKNIGLMSIIFLSTFVVAVRSFTSYGIPTGWNKTVLQSILLFSFMGLGKALGG